MNPQHPDLESGALSIRATGLSRTSHNASHLLGFTMDRMCLAELAILLEFKAVLHGPLVFRGGIVPLLAIGAGQRNDVSHN